ncbi:MAG: cobalamin-dependent protein [Proteobacteria bacterium]|nr:cobalamin-dependent protein [Pseudomonadota bacterium]
MKILFVNFNLGATAGINNGIAAMSAVLKERGHQVELIFLAESLGYDFDLQRLKKDIVRINPDVLGLSVMEPQFKYAVEFCRYLTTYYSGVVVVGGPYPTMDPETVLSVEGVNAVCVGEGEEAICELMDAVYKGENINSIKNLWVKSSDGSIARNKLRPFIDLRKVPPEDKNLFDLNKILSLKNYQLEVMASRGCAFKCTYCINGSYVALCRKLSDGAAKFKDYIRVKDAQIILTEIKNVITLHPEVKKIAFIDDNFATNLRFLEDFCLLYKEDIGLPFG